MTNYEILKINESLLKVLLNNHINVNDVNNLLIYSQYSEMKKKGHKTSYIAMFLAEKYGITDRAIYKIVKRMNRKVEI